MLLCNIAHGIICTRLFRGKMHSDCFNGIEILQGIWQHGGKVGYCYPSGLKKTLCKWDIYVPLVMKELILSLLYMFSFPTHVPYFRYLVTNIQCVSYFKVWASCVVRSIVPARINLRILTLKYKSWRFTFRKFSLSSCYLHSRGPKNVPQHFVFNSLKFCSSSRLTNHTIPLYSTGDKIVVSYYLVSAHPGCRAV
jgi:hypothetical protein